MLLSDLLTHGLNGGHPCGVFEHLGGVHVVHHGILVDFDTSGDRGDTSFVFDPTMLPRS